MMEINDREITLDDLYFLNLSKLDEWKCIIPVGHITSLLKFSLTCHCLWKRFAIYDSFSSLKVICIFVSGFHSEQGAEVFVF